MKENNKKLVNYYVVPKWRPLPNRKNNNYKHIIPTYYTQESLCKLEPVELALVPEATAGRPDTYHILRNQL